MTVDADRLKIALHAHYAHQQKPYRVFHEVLCGPQGSCRIDTWVLHVTWTRYEAMAFEIKVSRSDFLRDLKDGKWRAYLPHCSHLYFASPRDVIKASEVPDGVGLVWCGDGDALRFVRKATARDWKPDFVMLLALLFDLDTPILHRQESTYALRQRCSQAESRRLLSVREMNDARQKAINRHTLRAAGRETAKTIGEAREVLRKAHERIEHGERASELLYQIGQVLGVSSWHLREQPEKFLADAEAAIGKLPTFKDAQKLQAAHEALGRLLAATPPTASGEKEG